VKRPNFFTAKSFDDRWQEVEVYVRLWRGTLDQLLQDLIYTGGGKEDKKAHINAWEWFENEQDEFNLVCDLADLDPIRTRKELNNLVEKMHDNKNRRKFKDRFKIVERKKTTRIWE
jgi:hypothetical protein|tara:strand:- start:300 stop:647 length:348 start_codon:yes stop_codon:yes gene_type:complete